MANTVLIMILAICITIISVVNINQDIQIGTLEQRISQLEKEKSQ